MSWGAWKRGGGWLPRCPCPPVGLRGGWFCIFLSAGSRMYALVDGAPAFICKLGNPRSIWQNADWLLGIGTVGWRSKKSVIRTRGGYVLISLALEGRAPSAVEVD